MWYRHRQTGDRGRRQTRDGEEVVVYDRPRVDQWVPYHPNEWRPEVEPRTYAMAELGQIAWAADRELCRVLGDHGRAMKKWSELTETERDKWIVQGPKSAPERIELFDAIMAVLKPMSGA